MLNPILHRRRLEDARAALDNFRPVELSHAPDFVGTITTTSIGTPPTIILVEPAKVTGTQSEGSSVTLSSVMGVSIPVVFLGPHAAVTGDVVTVKNVGNRWATQYTKGGGGGGGGTVALPGCSCTAVPTTLHMTSNAPTCNEGMFQSCTLLYGPVPSCYAALLLGANAFLSTTSFVDTNLDTFQYYFNCQGSQFDLGRVYCTSIFGSPYLDVARFSWNFPATGNTCSPFAMTNGTVFPGGDPTCSGQITILP
jgi:hypothetical protein